MNRRAQSPDASDYKRVFKGLVLLTLEKLGGDLVTLSELRRNLSAPRKDIDDALLALERDRKISLSIAQSPYMLGERRKDGIEREGRGLLYYATVK